MDRKIITVNQFKAMQSSEDKKNPFFQYLRLQFDQNVF